MAFSDSNFRGAMLVMLNGEDAKSAPLVTCERCKRPMLRVFLTRRVRDIDPGLVPSGAAHRDVCITKDWMGPVPCPKAIAAAGLIDRLMDASRR